MALAISAKVVLRNIAAVEIICPTVRFMTIIYQFYQKSQILPYVEIDIRNDRFDILNSVFGIRDFSAVSTPDPYGNSGGNSPKIWTPRIENDILNKQTVVS